MDGRGQPLQAILDHIIGRPRLQALDRAILAHGAGDKDERGVRLHLFGHLKRLGPAIRRHRIIAENQVNVRREHRGLEFSLAPGRNDLAGDPGGGKRRGDQLAVPRVVFEVNDPETAGCGHALSGVEKLSGAGSFRSAQKTPTCLVAAANSAKSNGLTT